MFPMIGRLRQVESIPSPGVRVMLRGLDGQALGPRRAVCHNELRSWQRGESWRYMASNLNLNEVLFLVAYCTLYMSHDTPRRTRENNPNANASLPATVISHAFVGVKQAP